MSILDNVEFIEHNQITAKDLWKDGVHLKESGKVFIAKNLDLFFFFAQQPVLKPRVCESTLSLVMLKN